MSNREDRCCVVLLSGGSGKRMGSSVAKQYLELKGKPVLWYSLQAIQNSEYIDECVLVIRPEDEEFVRRELLEKYNFDKVLCLANAGAERYESVWNGLNMLPEDTDYVFIHDGARPFLTEEIIRNNYEGVKKYGACVTAVKSKDTVKIVDESGRVLDTPDRKNVWNMQTPQTFSRKLICDAYKKAIESGSDNFTDDAMMVERFSDSSVYVVEGSYGNIKITTPEDLLFAESLD